MVIMNNKIWIPFWIISWFLINHSWKNYQLTGSQSQLGNATTIAIRKEQGQWKLADGKKFESTEGNPTEMEGSYGTTGKIKNSN